MVYQCIFQSLFNAKIEMLFNIFVKITNFKRIQTSQEFQIIFPYPPLR